MTSPDHTRRREREAAQPSALQMIVIISLFLGVGIWGAIERDTYDPPSADIHHARNLPDMRLDINQATGPEFMLLPNIGEVLGFRIARDREAHGPFRSIEELDRVSGIGPRTIEGIRRYVRPVESIGKTPATDG